MKTEDQLIEVCREIGGISGNNGHFTAGLARLLDNGGQSLLTMTVSELLSLSRENKETFNKVHGASKPVPQKEDARFTPEMQERLLTDNDVAAMLSCSRKHVWDCTHDGRLPHPYKFGTLARWKLSEILEVFSNLKVSGKPTEQTRPEAITK